MSLPHLWTSLAQGSWFCDGSPLERAPAWSLSFSPFDQENDPSTMSCTFRRLSRGSGHGGGSGPDKNLSAGCLHDKSAQWKKNHLICGEECCHGSNDHKTEGEHHQGSSGHGRKTAGARFHGQAGCKAVGAGYHGLTLRKMV